MYVATLLVGTIAATIALILSAQQTKERRKDLDVFFISILLYAISDFLVYFYLFEDVSDQFIYALITISDSLLILMTSAWLYIIAVTAGWTHRITRKRLIVATIAYLILQEGSSCLMASYGNGTISTASTFGKYFIQFLCILWTVINIVLALICTRRLLKQEPRGLRKNLALIFPISFICYIAWITQWDYRIWFEGTTQLSGQYAYDLIFPVYCILSISLVIYFIKFGPLSDAERSLISENAIQLISERYALTVRESEVLQEINCGKSNLQIAETLCISENTVKRHINSILKKTSCHNRHEILYKLNNPSDLTL